MQEGIHIVKSCQILIISICRNTVHKHEHAWKKTKHISDSNKCKSKHARTQRDLFCTWPSDDGLTLKIMSLFNPTRCLDFLFTFTSSNFCIWLVNENFQTFFPITDLITKTRTAKQAETFSMCKNDSWNENPLSENLTRLAKVLTKNKPSLLPKTQLLWAHLQWQIAYEVSAAHCK